jgi:4-hydroxy-tetrahydrodipicolinate synthase
MFRGSIVALVTPMLMDKIDLPRLQELVEFHIAAGTHAIVAAGTTGESGTLSHQEKLLVIKTVIEQAHERIPVIAGTAANATKDCIALTKEAMEYGAHAVLIMTPAYIKPTQEGLFQHYSQIAHSVAIPIILYNQPSRTACDLLPETVGRLAHISNIVGIKDGTGQITRLQQIKQQCEERIDVYSGDDPTAVEWMLAKLCDEALDGNEAVCRQLNEQLIPLHRILGIETNPIPVKWALSKMGLLNGEIRSPLTILSNEHQQAVEKVLRTLQLVN